MRNMQANMRRFNLFLALMAMTLLCGCQVLESLGLAHYKQTGALRVHMESAATADTSQTISVLRANPVLITISKEPFLTEADIVSAKVVDTPGGFAIQIHFDENGGWLLEQYTANNPGMHLAIFGQWGDKLANGRWLAVPLITHRIAGGVLTFTPDMSRAEADQLVLGLNDFAKHSSQ